MSAEETAGSAPTELTLTLGDQPVHLRRAGDDAVPVLYLHDVPSTSKDFEPLLARTGGIAPDWPGFGRSGKRGDLDYSPGGYARFVADLLDLLGLERVRLCVHGWGAAGLIWAMEEPERVERLVVVDALPLLPGLTWHPWARSWRGRFVGEVAVGLMVRRVMRRMLARTSAPDSPVPDLLARRMHDAFDQGSQRALMRLHRAAAPEHLAEFGAGLGDLGMPALVVWGGHDTWFDQRFGAAYAAVLGDAELELVPGAGHWPWLEDEATLERIAGFLG